MVTRTTTAVLVANVGMLLATSYVPRAAIAQDPVSINSLQKGANALLFQIGDNFHLGSFSGASISYKVHSSAGTAFRAGLSVSGSIRDAGSSGTAVDSIFSYVSTPDSLSRLSLPAESDNRNDMFIAVNAQKLFYTSPSKSLSVFWGFGPGASLSLTDQEQSSSDRVSTELDSVIVVTRSSRSFDGTAWAVGASIALGVEWFPRHNIGLLAEYDTGVNYRHTTGTIDFYISQERYTGSGLTNRSVGSQTDEQTFDDFTVSPGSVKLGLTVYFGM